MDIAVDFDGTCVSHEYPNIGKDIGAIPVLKALNKKGHRLILYTMRSEDKLEEAINWFRLNDIPLYGIQINPEQMSWTSSSKCYAQLYIDDAALGCPLVHKMVKHIRPYVDWGAVENELKQREIL